MKSEDNPAFPIAEYYGNGQLKSITKGLTKREYFAAMALSGLAVSWNQHNDHEHAAKLAIGMADELLKQLEP